jgi:drug/metabolite transporter (DMT)-like permease
MSQTIADAISYLAPEIGFLFTNGLGFAGAILIGYSVLAEYTKPWEPIEKVSGFVSPLLTILGTLVTAASIYVPYSAVHPPWPESRFLASPIVIVACIIALWFLVRDKKLPPMLVNGFALLAIAGALKRIFPNPHLQ